MSNLEADPDEVVCTSAGEAGAATPRIEVLEPREVPLGGPRALTVRRTLPQRRRSLIGAWCFADHYGPTPDAGDRVMDVPPHPHTGLQTVSWLFAGDIEHRDSVGSVAVIRPGQVNLMTAGSGIQHSEMSTGAAAIVHGVQLWVALPDTDRAHAPFFEHHVPEPFRHDDATISVFVGELLGRVSPITTFTPLLGAQLDVPAGGRVALPARPEFEYGLLVDAGAPTLQGESVDTNHLGVVPTGATELVIEAGATPLRALLLGGTPLGEQIVMWWNFVGRSHDEIVAFRTQWQHHVGDPSDRDGRFGRIDDAAAPPLPAPELPNARLTPRS